MKTVNNLIKSNDTLLESYVQTAKRIAALSALLKEVLPAALRGHCEVANYKDGCLIIQANSAAWATQLRYLVADLQTRLSAIAPFKELTTIRYYVATAAAISPPGHQHH